MCVFLVVDFRKVSEQLNNDFELTERDCNCRCGSISPGNTCNTSETHLKHSFSSVNGMPFVHIFHIQQCVCIYGGFLSEKKGGFPSSHHFSWEKTHEMNQGFLDSPTMETPMIIPRGTDGWTTGTIRRLFVGKGVTPSSTVAVWPAARGQK